MDLINLLDEIKQVSTFSDSEFNVLWQQIEENPSIYPFNSFEYLFQHLTNKGKITFDNYTDIRERYILANPNLWIFEISAPRTFGENFAQNHVKTMCSDIQKASKALDSMYNQEYDLFLDGLKIEVKASRATDKSSNLPLYMSAIDRHSDKDFLMNFQQLKPQCCHVFVWVLVFRDIIETWVIPSDDVKNHAEYSKGQHRGNHGNEGQLHITSINIDGFQKYKVDSNTIKNAILASQ